VFGPAYVQVTGVVYQSQLSPPVRILFPPAILVALGALAVICACATAIMVWIVRRASLSQSLRLNED
jgi:uncharacterized iron-regulated membrane protein